MWSVQPRRPPIPAAKHGRRAAMELRWSTCDLLGRSGPSRGRPGLHDVSPWPASPLRGPEGRNRGSAVSATSGPRRPPAAAGLRHGTHVGRPPASPYTHRPAGGATVPSFGGSPPRRQSRGRAVLPSTPRGGWCCAPRGGARAFRPCPAPAPRTVRDGPRSGPTGWPPPPSPGASRALRSPWSASVAASGHGHGAAAARAASGRRLRSSNAARSSSNAARKARLPAGPATRVEASPSA